MLCNLGAAELLMPTGSLPDLKNKRLTIEGLLELRKQYQVSAESLALRYVNMTEQPAAVFVASRKPIPAKARYHIDYAFSSRSWPVRMQRGFLLPEDTVVQKCTAIGFTAKGQEKWAPHMDEINVECVGLPPYAGSIYPRGMGILHPLKGEIEPAAKIRYVVGDALSPSGTGTKILVHVVNDKTPNWGAGFGMAVRDAWPPIQDEFRSWWLKDRARIHLGNIFFSKISDGLFVSPMICQHGYGPSEKPRIRYAALKTCLQQVLAKATELKASVHMPRIGSGYAGGAWALIEQLVDENLCRYGVPVVVYDLPGAQKPPEQRSLFG
jgi:O-acetyl-ADP-ribose deacetylase (regulator of RNase III)